MVSRATKPLTLFMEILKEHQRILFVKNYTEDRLKPLSGPKLSEQLQQKFLEAYVNNVLVYKLAEINLEITGYFERIKDKVAFDFLYIYDPKKIALDLRSLKVTMNEEYEKIYSIDTHPSRGLPSSEKVYQDMLNMHKAALLSQIQEEKEARKGKGRRPH